MLDRLYSPVQAYCQGEAGTAPVDSLESGVEATARLAADPD